MNRLVWCLLLAAGLTAMTVPQLTAQQPPAQSPALSLGYYGLTFLNRDADLQKELRISEEQAKKLAEHAGLRARVTRAQDNDKERAQVLKAIDKALAQTLEPGQLSRLKQIVLQQLASNGPTRQQVGRISEVAEQLKLTEEQQKKLNAGAALTDVLSDDQKGTWKAMLGEKFVGQLGRTIPPFLPSPPTSLRYALEQSVQEELKVTEEQQKQINALLKKWQQSPVLANPARGEENRQKIEELTGSLNEALFKILEPIQGKRLRQIVLQQLTRENKNSVLSQPEVVAGLKLTEEQQTLIAKTHNERTKALLSLFLTGENAEEIARKVAGHGKETTERLNKLVTADQQARLKDMIGEPFEGQIRPQSGFPSRPPVTTPLFLFITGLQFVENKALQEELKVSEVQVKRLLELREKSQEQALTITGDPSRTAEQRDKLRREHAAENAKALADVLEPEQLTRFKQLVLQYYDATPSSATLGRFVEVAEGLKLTAEQKERIRNRTKLTDVLDDKQQARWQEMLGKPFENARSLRPRIGGFGGPGGPGGASSNLVLRYLEEKSVQEDLKMTDEQLKKLPGLTEKWGELTRDRANWGSGPEYANKLAKAEASLAKSVGDVLEARQVDRLHQIERQQNGLSSLFGTPQVQKDLGLSEEQLSQISSIQEDHAKTRRLLRSVRLTESLPPGDEDYAKTLESFSKILTKKLTAALTADQRDKLKAMLGEPFKGTIRTGFGGPGGQGGPPGGPGGRGRGSPGAPPPPG